MLRQHTYRSGSVLPWVLFCISLVVIGFLSWRLYGGQGNTPNAAANQSVKIIAAVGKLIVLPTDETPTIAVVTDPSKLQDQPFFSDAKQGDDVLIYTKSGKAILYDPTINKVIGMAPINGIGTSSSSQ